ncbi:MAG: glycosyltransferase family 4 protein, partial [Cyanobacteria bacterium J06649_4]
MPLNVLLIVEQCNPERASVPLVGYNFYRSIAQLANVTLVTHSRNQAALEKAHPEQDIVYIRESNLAEQYYKFAALVSSIRGKIIWPLRLTLAYPIYAEFNRKVNALFGQDIAQGTYDIVHAITPMMPRYPVKAAQAVRTTPFILGPVNGGIPYPKGFRGIARQEFAGLNFLRWVGRAVIPGYRQTYENATYVLAGSGYTARLIQSLFQLPSENIKYVYENGIEPAFLKQLIDSAQQTEPQQTEPQEAESQEADLQQRTNATGNHATASRPNDSNSSVLKLLFVGRLVPYKSADILIEAVANLPELVRSHIHLTIVGDGPERNKLEQQVQRSNLADKVSCTGWIPQPETLRHYQAADLFCFPSVREFGGAVVLEAMGNGLPCIVVNHGGIGEYVSDSTGFRIEPVSRRYVVTEMCDRITQLFENPNLRQTMSQQAVQRAKAFTWPVKGQQIIDIYHQA